MKTTINFGKIDFNNCGRKINPVTVDIELRDMSTKYGFDYKEFSVCADVWNSKKTDIICGGQCLDEILPFMIGTKYEDSFSLIYKLWKKWHLNGLKAGTPKQEEFCKDWLSSHPYDYTALCSELEARCLFTDKFKGYGHRKQYKDEPYNYGCDWIIDVIPDEDIDLILGLFNKNYVG